jgi:hypothetical protein
MSEADRQGLLEDGEIIEHDHHWPIIQVRLTDGRIIEA